MGQSTVEDDAAAAAAAPKSKPTILVVPPRGSMESFFAGGMGGLGFSPGPMTLVSSFFSEQGPFTFSQLLAGAMSSPTPMPDDEEKGFACFEDGKITEDGGGGGYKRNRPMNLAVAQPQPESLSPMFMVPPGLSPSGLLNSPGFLSPLRSPFGMSHQQALAHVTAQAALSQSYVKMQEEIQQRSSSALPHENHSPPLPVETSAHQPSVPKMESSEVSQLDKKVVNFDKPAGDGYNWRKYGQKNVKASECPRSYYKCTHASCPVKKKVERSFDGRVSEIVYKGQHNHDPPQPSNKRGKDSSALEANRLSEVNSEAVSLQKMAQQSFESQRNNNEAENNVIVVEDGDDDEPIAKRRSMEVGQSVQVSSHQTITESKIVVQTRSEVDLLDDGYKWRKYGQKVVKGNPHPRSYYRCTYAGCTVRKHVERASTDPKAVITTYEGKHNHEIPSGRFSGSNASVSTQLGAQKSVAKNHSPSGEMGDFGSQDKLPATLILKEEQVAT